MLAFLNKTKIFKCLLLSKTNICLSSNVCFSLKKHVFIFKCLLFSEKNHLFAKFWLKTLSQTQTQTQTPDPRRSPDGTRWNQEAKPTPDQLVGPSCPAQISLRPVPPDLATNWKKTCFVWRQFWKIGFRLAPILKKAFCVRRQFPKQHFGWPAYIRKCACRPRSN